MDSNGSLWVLIGLYSFLSILKGPYGFLYFLMLKSWFTGSRFFLHFHTFGLSKTFLTLKKFLF